MPPEFHLLSVMLQLSMSRCRCHGSYLKARDNLTMLSTVKERNVSVRLYVGSDWNHTTV